MLPSVTSSDMNLLLARHGSPWLYTPSRAKRWVNCCNACSLGSRESIWSFSGYFMSSYPTVLKSGKAEVVKALGVPRSTLIGMCHLERLIWNFNIIFMARLAVSMVPSESRETGFLLAGPPLRFWDPFWPWGVGGGFTQIQPNSCKIPLWHMYGLLNINRY